MFVKVNEIMRDRREMIELSNYPPLSFILGEFYFLAIFILFIYLLHFSSHEFILKIERKQREMLRTVR